jgi:organic hydroperoxide reductase OsmC/OhrA/predicted SAM-dependent methyltransferase
MPRYAENGKSWTCHIVCQLNDWLGSGVQRVLDIGTGPGTNSDWSRQLLPKAEWAGIEAWAPYVERYDLESKYDTMIVADARFIDWQKLGQFDVAFIGHILEHITKEQALTLFQEVSRIARFVVLQVPITQQTSDYRFISTSERNRFEQGVKQDWTNEEVLHTFPNICGHMIDCTVGTYVCAAQASDRDMLLQLAETTTVRLAEIEWKGSCQDGSGQITFPTSGLELNYSPSLTTKTDKCLTPEDLLGSVQAAWFAMALSEELAKAGYYPERIKTSAKVYLNKLTHFQEVPAIELIAEARVPGMDAKLFQELVEVARRRSLMAHILEPSTIRTHAQLMPSSTQGNITHSSMTQAWTENSPNLTP